MSTSVSEPNVGIIREFNVGVNCVDFKLFTDVVMGSHASNVGLWMPAVT